MPRVKAMITAAQVKAARALLGLSQNELAKRTGLGIATIKRLELSTELRGAATTLWKVQTVLEDIGVEFLAPSQESGPGVRLRTSAGFPKHTQKSGESLD